MIRELAKSIDTFLGKAMHVRCFDHSLNLMAKVRVGDPGNFCVLNTVAGNTFGILSKAKN